MKALSADAVADSLREEHKDILKACVAGEVARAVALTEENIERTKASLAASARP